MILVRRLTAAAFGAALLIASDNGALAQYPLKSDANPHAGVARAYKMHVQGIDVSRWQGTIDWDQVRAAGTQFAYIKATEGGDHLDPKFRENWQGASRVGIPRGAYHFVYWCRPAHEQALWFILNVPSDPDALPPALDVEWNSHSRNCPHRVPRETALEKIRVLLAAMEAHTGRRPIIYTDTVFHREVLEGQFEGYHFWLRSVAAEPHQVYNNRPWTFWQFTTTGRVPGIEGDVDRNAFHGTQADWDRVVRRLQAGS